MQTIRRLDRGRRSLPTYVFLISNVYEGKLEQEPRDLDSIGAYLLLATEVGLCDS